MAGEEKKKQSVPDEVNGDGYDDTKNTSTGVGAGVNGYDSVYGTGSVVFPEVAQGNNAYQQWLKNQGLNIQGDYAQTVAQAQQQYAQALAQNKAAYERQLGTYGAKAENLAQSGLSASGYSDYLAGQAYAQQQADNVKAGQALSLSQQSALQSAQKTAREQYAKYLSQVNEQTADIYSSLQSTGGKLSDEAKKYYETLGYSPEAITKAETLYSQYQATPEYKQAQVQNATLAALQGASVEDATKAYGDEAIGTLRTNVSTALSEWANATKDMATVLKDLGYDVNAMDEKSRTAAFTNILAYADENTKNNVVKRELENAFYNADRASDTERMNIIQNQAVRINDLFSKGIISEETKNKLAQQVVDKLGISLDNGVLYYTSSESSGRKDTNTEWVHPGKEVKDNATINKLSDLGDNINVAKIGDEYYVKGYVEPDGTPSWFRLEGLGKSKDIMDSIVSMTNSLNIPLSGGGVIGKQGGKEISLYTKENVERAKQKKMTETQERGIRRMAEAGIRRETAPAAVQGQINEYRDMIFREMGYDPSNMTEEQKMQAIREWAEK